MDVFFYAIGKSYELPPQVNEEVAKRLVRDRFLEGRPTWRTPADVRDWSFEFGNGVWYSSPVKDVGYGECADVYSLEDFGPERYPSNPPCVPIRVVGGDIIED